MAKKSLLANNVIICNIPLQEVYKRTASSILDEFGSNRVILKRRLDYTMKNMPNMIYFF